MEYLLVKWVHIFSAMLLFGTGLGSAFFKWRTDRTCDVTAIVSVNKSVVLADWVFTTPAVIIQPLTGLLLAYYQGYSLLDSWLFLSIVLFLFAGCCWLPVVYIQIVMRNMSEHTIREKRVLSARYFKWHRIWFWLGVPAFFSVLMILVLMVFKPSLHWPGI